MKKTILIVDDNQFMKNLLEKSISKSAAEAKPQPLNELLSLPPSLIASSEILIMYECADCGREHYFETDSLPGGKEHCEYCETCGSKLRLAR